MVQSHSTEVVIVHSVQSDGSPFQIAFPDTFVRIPPLCCDAVCHHIRILCLRSWLTGMLSVKLHYVSPMLLLVLDRYIIIRGECAVQMVLVSGVQSLQPAFARPRHYLFAVFFLLIIILSDVSYLMALFLCLSGFFIISVFLFCVFLFIFSYSLLRQFLMQH